MILAAVCAALAGTSDWVVLDPRSEWSTEERARVDEASAAIPASLAVKLGKVRIARVSALPARAEEPRAHAIAVPHGRREVRLSPRGSGAAADDELVRALVHAFAHLADAAVGLSAHPSWRRLSGWGAFPGSRPAERNPASFAEEAGLRSAREDLATLMEVFLTPRRLPSDPPLHAACRMPSKWAYLDGALGAPAETPRCATIEQVGLDPARVEAIDLIFVRASARAAGSILGHTLLGVVYMPDETGERHEDTYELAAVTEGVTTNSVAYVWRGLTGGFGSRIRREPLRTTVLRYAEDNRELARLRLTLSEPQKRALLQRLDELQHGWRRPYLFLTRNCTQLPLEAVAAGLGAEIPLPAVFGPDALVGAIERLGELTPVPRESVDEYSPADRSVAAAALRDGAGRRLRELRPSESGWLDSALRATRARNVHERALGYRALGEHASSLLGNSAEARHVASRYLFWSDHWERVRLVGPGRGRREADDPAIRALWFATAATAEAANIAGLGPVQTDIGHDEMLRAMTRPEPSRTSHTPLVQTHVELAAEQQGAERSAWVRASTALYRFRLGESRRYTVASGIDASLFALDLDLGTDVQGPSDRNLRGGISLLSLQRAFGRRHVLIPGFYMHLGRARLSTLGDERSWVEPLGLGGALELFEVDNHRLHVGVTTGTAFQVSAPDPGAPALPTVTLPVGLFARAGSARHATTGIELAAEGAPWWQSDARGWELRGQLAGQLHLGEAAGADVAISARYQAVASVVDDAGSDPGLSGEGGPGPPMRHRVSIGLAFEPF